MKNNMEARKVIFEQKQVHWFFFRLGVPYIDSYSNKLGKHRSLLASASAHA